MTERFTTAIEAWRFLVTRGGMDVDGRDELLTEQLRGKLAPEAPDIDMALRGVSVEVFLNTFFGLLCSFVSIVRDLLAYFERADAAEGPGQWVLTLGKGKDKLEVNLDHFRQWLKLFEEQASRHPVPILPYLEMWNLQAAFNSLPGRKQRELEPPSYALEDDLETWLENYERTSWLPLPNVVARTVLRPGPIGEYATLIHELASAVSSVVPNDVTMRGSLSQLRQEVPPEIAEYLRIEHDGWTKTNLLNLISFEHASPPLQSEVERNLVSMFKNAPHRPARFQMQMQTLIEVVSLPVWKKRYELYSAWIFTRFLSALPDHEIELHHENGSLRFAFRETLLATVRSLPTPLLVYAEKRTKAHRLRGHGRQTAIQPDYSIWTEGNKECKLAIECKHYKKASTMNFHDALFDYSTNLPEARVLLVNYGPVNDALRAMTHAGGENGRQFCWGNVTPEFPAQVEAFEQAIRKAIGNPVSRVVVPSGAVEGGVLVIDVSSSMKSTLTKPEAQQYVLKLVEECNLVHLAAVDDALHGVFKADAAGFEALLEASSFGATDLRGPAQQLAETYSKVLILTDEDGLKTLGPTAEVLPSVPSGSSHAVDLLHVARFLPNA